MLIRQSDIKQFMACSLRYKFQHEGAPREQSSALSFGTVIHDAILLMEVQQSLGAGLARFDELWDNLGKYNQACQAAIPGEVTLEYAYLIPRNTHQGYKDIGHRILRDWWQLIQWESDIVLGREYNFTVPIGSHQLTGTVDKLALRPLKGAKGFGVLVSDYKTSAKQPTRDYLQHDIQFSAYCYATTQPEFWVNLPPVKLMDGSLMTGPELYAKYLDAQRMGEWVHLRTPRRIDAGVRTDVHYNRLLYAIDQIEASVATGIFVPNLNGDTCQYCEFRKICGLPPLEQEELVTR